MKFILFVEGQTEDKALPEFLGRWLNEKLETRVGIKVVRFEGWPEMVRNIERKVKGTLADPKTQADVIAVLALLDLYGPTFYPDSKQEAKERYEWAKADLEKQVNHPKFHQYFAVHETEAWLLSDPAVFPSEITEALQNNIPPEQINFHEPPGKLLEKLYLSRLKRKYRKTVDGKNLFVKLNPKTAYDKCPSLKLLLDDMLMLAQEAGL